MNYKVKLVYLILIAIVPISLFFYYNSILENKNSELQEEKSVFEHHKTTYTNLILRLSKNLVRDLNDKIIVTDINDVSHDLKDVIGDSLKLIYRFKESACDICYSDQISKLKELSKFISQNSIILLVSFSKQNVLKILTSTYDLNFPIYNVDSKLILNNPLESYNEPYLFLINKEYKASYFFVPDKTVPDLTYKYMEVVKKMFNR